MTSKPRLSPCRQGRRLSSRPGEPSNQGKQAEQEVREVCAALALRISSFLPGGVGRRDSNEMRRALHDAILDDTLYAQMRAALDNPDLPVPGEI